MNVAVDARTLAPENPDRVHTGPHPVTRSRPTSSVTTPRHSPSPIGSRLRSAAGASERDRNVRTSPR